MGPRDAPSPEGDEYEVFGERLALHAGSAPLRDMVRREWAEFRATTPGPSRSGVHFHLVASQAPGRLKEWQFFNNGNLLLIADDRRLVTGYFYREPWQVHLTAYRQDLDFIYYYLLEPLWLMVLMRRGLVPWHSAAVTRGGAAVLIAGPSGSGKSTTALALVRAGFSFLADDEIFLRRRGNGVEALAVTNHLYATDHTLSMFPDLAHLWGAPLVQRGHASKRRLTVPDVFPGAATPSPGAPVRLILFPRVSPDGATTSHPLSARDVVARCLGQKPKEYPTVVTDPRALATQLDTYVTLAETARSFDVHLGRDLARLPGEIDALLA